MFDWLRKKKDRSFDVNDILPFVQVPKGEAPIVLEKLEVSVVVAGMFAETSQTMTFRNPNRRALEGSLSFPLPDGGVVCGYAIDLDGELVDGVIVQKHEARRILEAEIRKGVDPGLVEHVQGNVYRTRIYPLPPGGTRTVRVIYVSDLACDGNSAGYHLPLQHAQSIERVSLRVEIKKGDVAPHISGGFGNLTLKDLPHAFVAEAALPKGAACDDLVVRLPDLPRHLRAVEVEGDEAFFAISSAVPEAKEAAWHPRRVAILWDASGSRTDVERDLAVVSRLFDQWPELVVDVRVVRDVVDGETRTFSGRAARDALLKTLQDAPRDGGTNLAGLDLGALAHSEDEAWLLFSDGQNTLGRGLPKQGQGALPIFAFSSAAGCDSAYLRHLATSSDGLYVDLLQTKPETALRMLAESQGSLRVSGGEGCADVHARRAAGRLLVVGRLTGAMGQVRLTGTGAPDDHISIPRSMGVSGRLLGRAWAGYQTRALAVVDPTQPEIFELARWHGVVAANASLLVLETLEQHVEHGIEPAATRKALRTRYLDAVEHKRREERATRGEHVESVVALWDQRVRWWETDFKPREKEVEAKKMRAPPRPSAAMESRMDAMDMEMAPAAALDDGDAFGEEVSAASAMPPPPMMMSRSLASPAPAPGGAAAPAQAAADGAPRGASIHIKPWSADTPYLTKLKKSGDPYAAYLVERSSYATSPSFFLDCGDFFLGCSERALGLRVLSNLVELGLDDPPLMRMYAWRLQQAGELTSAIDVFERVRRLRDDEPQSHRDLALALSDRWEKGGAEADATRAMGLLYDVIEEEWERFPEIELIALMELNRLIAKARERGVATPQRIDRRLIRLLDLDLRISMSWDLDLTDVDLHVFEPNGEHAYYGQNQTSGGGLVSRDFRQGYGPEEYVRKNAQAGAYTIKAHYYGSHQQDLVGGCTVIVHVMLNFGRPNEERQVLTLRLDRPSDQVVVGEVTFAGRAPAPTDWRPRFKALRRGMTIDEIAKVVGQPSRIEGSTETVLVYDVGGDVVHVIVAPRLVAVKQVIDGGFLDLL